MILNRELFSLCTDLKAVDLLIGSADLFPLLVANIVIFLIQTTRISENLSEILVRHQLLWADPGVIRAPLSFLDFILWLDWTVA